MRVCGEIIDSEENELSMSNRGIITVAFSLYTPFVELFSRELAAQCIGGDMCDGGNVTSSPRKLALLRWPFPRKAYLMLRWAVLGLNWLAHWRS